MLTRRQFLRGMSLASVGTASFGGYAVAEPWRLNFTRYALTPKGWPKGLKLRLALLADLHVCNPWMGVERLNEIVRLTNAENPDAVLLLGDYVAGHKLERFSTKVADRDWAGALGGLKARFGTHAVLGNHDWWDDRAVQSSRKGVPSAQRALEDAGIPVHQNDALRFVKDGRPFWLAGLGDQWAFWPRPERYQAFVRGGKVDYDGVDDLDATLGKITDEAPVVLMAHEPDIFPDVPDRVALTVCGHTHGGQVTLGGYAPIVPSKYGSRFLYGHIVEEQRNLIVSGGLGCSSVPVRFGVPPEIVIVELGGNDEAVA